MKKILIICGLILLAVVLIVMWLFSSNSHQPQSVIPQTTFSTSSPNASNEPQVQPVIREAFLKQIQNSDQVTLTNAVVVGSYALQSWGDANKGGEALLKYNQTSGWVLVSMGGGAWDAPSLVAEGVPQDVAQQLTATGQ